MQQRIIALLAALVLMLTLLAGCGAGQADQQSPEPAPAEEQKDPPVSDPGPRPAEPARSQDPVPSEDGEPPAGEESPAGTIEVPPEEPAPDPEEPPETEPETSPAQPEPEPEPVEAVPEDGSYTAAVALEGGTGRATVESPAALRCENGQFWATIVWSSPNFDYMKVDGETYLQTNTEGNSTFEIPVAAFDQKLDVIADTVAMTEPHEVEYTLTFDSATLEKQ